MTIAPEAARFPAIKALTGLLWSFSFLPRISRHHRSYIHCPPESSRVLNTNRRNKASFRTSSFIFFFLLYLIICQFMISMLHKKIISLILLLSLLAFALPNTNAACEEHLECCCCDDITSLLCECLTDQDGTDTLSENLITSPRLKDASPINSGTFYPILAIGKASASGFSTINKSSILYRSKYATRSQVLLI